MAYGERIPLPIQKAAALTGVLVGMAAPAVARAAVLNYGHANKRMEKTADRMGASVLDQYKEARRTADPNVRVTIKGKDDRRTIKVIRSVPAESGGIAAYAATASMNVGQNGRLNPDSTYLASIAARDPSLASGGNGDTSKGTVFSFDIRKGIGYVCASAARDAKCDWNLPVWRSTAAYRPEDGYKLPEDVGFVVSSPDGSILYRQQTSEPWPVDMGGDGKRSLMFSNEFTSEAQEAQGMLSNAERGVPIPESYDPPANFESNR